MRTKIFHLFAMLLLSQSMMAQESKPYLVTEGLQWGLLSCAMSPPPNQTTLTYRLQGDTIINGKCYLIEHRSKDINLRSWMPTKRFVREENGKVYRKSGNDPEYVLLDYEMNVGDTLRYNDTPNAKDYVYVRLIGVRDTILPNGDGVARRCYDALVGEYVDEVYTEGYNESFVEGIGWLNTGASDHDFFLIGGWQELLHVMKDDKLLYQREEGVYWQGDKVDELPISKKGYGYYYGDNNLYLYTLDETKEVTDSTDYAQWYDKTVLYFDVDTIGPNAFTGATFRQGQILYFTERLNTIFKDAFTDINIELGAGMEWNINDDLTLVFSGKDAPNIDKSNIMNYSDSTYRINFAVPDIEAYVAEDLQWTYTNLITIDDLLRGYVAPENEVVVSDSASVDLDINVNSDSINTDGSVTLYATARPKKEIPVRIGDKGSKDIISRAPAWMRYTIEVVMTDCQGDTLYAEKKLCNAYDACDFVVTLAHYPAGNVVNVYSRSIDQYGNASDWVMKKITLMSVDTITAPEAQDTPYYDLQGRIVAHPTRGIYIKDGKKVILN